MRSPVHARLNNILDRAFTEDLQEDQTLKRNSLTIFHSTELGRVIEDNPESISQHLKLPFKYRTHGYIRKILSGGDVETYAKDFKQREPRHKNYLFSEQIKKDIVRTKILKNNDKMHADVHRVLEYYCLKKNVNYC